MEENSLNIKFLSKLLQITAKKPLLVNEMLQILKLEKKSIYRRLSADVPFTVDEIGLLANKYNISLDALLTDADLTKNYFFEDNPVLSFQSGFSSESFDTQILELKQIVAQKNTEVGVILNSIPKILFAKYKYINQFYLFKWGYYYSDLDSFKHFDSIIIPEKAKDYATSIHEEFKRIKYTFYIWGDMIYSNCVRDIQYFKSINRISAESVKLLKEELFHSVDMLEQLACDGKFIETGNKLELYTSSLELGPTRLYLFTDNYYTTSYVINYVKQLCSYNKETAEEAKSGFNAIKAASLRISQSAERNRILFFREQRKILNQL